MLTFSTPWLLMGLAGAGLPVLIHFLTRPRPRRVRYPAFHLLMEAGEGRQALHRLRTILVLLLRAIAVAALALAFTRPFFRQNAMETTPDAPRRVALVVDASLSMQAAVGGTPLFTRARAQAADLLRSLEPGSSAAVVLYGATPRPVLPALSRNLSVLHEGLASSKATMEVGAVDAALAQAASLLDGAGVVYVFSDFQRSNWAAVDFTRWPQVTFILRPVGEEGIANAGLTEIALSPATAIEGETVTLTATVFNSSPHDRVSLARLDLDSLSRTTEVELRPYSSGTVDFQFSLPAAGWTTGRVSLDADDLRADDVRYFRMLVRPRLRTLILSDVDRSDSSSAAFFLSAALAPSSYAAPGIEVKQRRGAEIERTALETADLFVLATPLRLGGDTVEIIARRVTDGAQLVLFLDGADAPPLLSALASASEGMVAPPFHLQDAIRDTTGGASLHLPTMTGGPLDLFRSPDQGDLGGLRVTRYFRTTPMPGRMAEVLLTYPDGSVAVALAGAGRGSAVYANLSVSPAGGNVPGSPLFPALLHELLKALRQGGEEDTPTPGRPWHLSAEVAEGGTPPRDVRLYGPDEAEVVATPLTLGQSLRLAVPPVAVPGHWRVDAEGLEPTVGVVNVHPDETETRRAPLDLLVDVGAGASVSVVDDAGDLAAAGQVRPLWPSLLALAAAALLAEMLLLAFWRRRATPPPAASLSAGGEA